MNYSIGCFGKLPIFSDFIRFNAANDELYALDQWFQKGIQSAKTKWGSGWEESFLKGKAWNFIFSPVGGKYFLAGVFVPNSDRSGRKYPFMIFLRVDRNEFKLPLFLAPGYFGSLWERMANLAQTGWQGLEMNELLEKVAKMDLSFPGDLKISEENYLATLRTRTMKTFWTDLLGDFNHTGKYVLDHQLRGALTPLRGTALSRLAFGLRFPIVRGREENSDIPFWFDFIRSLFHGVNEEPILFWNREESPGGRSLLAFFNQPAPNSFFYFLKPDLDEDSWFNLISENQGTIQKIMDKFPPDRKALLDREETTMEEFLIASGKFQ